MNEYCQLGFPSIKILKDITYVGRSLENRKIMNFPIGIEPFNIRTVILILIEIKRWVRRALILIWFLKCNLITAMFPSNQIIIMSNCQLWIIRTNPNTKFFSGFFILLVFIIGFLAWAYQSACPPEPIKLGSPDGLPITTPRIKLRDGRHLSYKEYGVPKEVAKYKIIYVHGFDSIKYYAVIATSASPVGIVFCS